MSRKKIEFSEEEIRYMIERYKAGYTLNQIAEDFDVTRNTIRNRLLANDVRIHPGGVRRIHLPPRQ